MHQNVLRILVIWALVLGTQVAQGTTQFGGDWWGVPNSHMGTFVENCQSPLMHVQIENSGPDQFAVKAMHFLCDGEVQGAVFFGKTQAFFNPIYNYTTIYSQSYVYGWAAQSAASIAVSSPDDNLNMDLGLNIVDGKLRVHLTIGQQRYLLYMVTAELSPKAPGPELFNIPENFRDFGRPGMRMGQCDSRLNNSGDRAPEFWRECLRAL